MQYTKEERWVLEEKYGGVQSAAFLRDSERLAAGEPVDYVIGSKPFLDCTIDLSFRPLIPRPETEYWTSIVIEMAEKQFAEKESVAVLDAFAGSGCIGIAVAKRVPRARVTFVDSAPNTKRQIRQNCDRNAISPDRSEIIEADVMTVRLDTYDLVVANPPYITPSTAEGRLAHGVSRYEPHAALFGGTDGLTHIRGLVARLPDLLRPGGLFAIEFDDIQRGDVEKIFETLPEMSPVFYKDQFGLDRFVIGRRLG